MYAVDAKRLPRLRILGNAKHMEYGRYNKRAGNSY